MEDVVIGECRGKLTQMKINNIIIYPVGARVRYPYICRIMTRGDEVITDFTVNPQYGIMRNLAGSKTDDRKYRE